MEKLTNNQQVLVKKLIGAAGAFLCLILMFTNFIRYTSTSTIADGSSITWDDGVSLYSFLFNKNYSVFDGPVSILREAFGYSYVVMWVSFILSIVSLIVLVVGIFAKKSLVSKIGSFILLGATIVLATIVFDREASGITVRYLNVFTLWYGLMVFITVFGLISTITLKDE